MYGAIVVVLNHIIDIFMKEIFPNSNFASTLQVKVTLSNKYMLGGFACDAKMMIVNQFYAHLIKCLPWFEGIGDVKDPIGWPQAHLSWGGAIRRVDVTIMYMHTTKHEKYKTFPNNTTDEWWIYKILKSNEFWNLIRPPETALTSKMDLEPSCQLRFGWSWTLWKAYLATFQTRLVSCPNSSRVNGNRQNKTVLLLKPNLGLGPCNRLGPSRKYLPPPPRIST